MQREGTTSLHKTLHACVNMCKIKGTNIGIKSLDFSGHRGKLCAVLTDGRIIIVPIGFFPDIKKLSIK